MDILTLGHNDHVLFEIVNFLTFRETLKFLKILFRLTTLDDIIIKIHQIYNINLIKFKFDILTQEIYNDMLIQLYDKSLKFNKYNILFILLNFKCKTPVEFTYKFILFNYIVCKEEKEHILSNIIKDFIFIYKTIKKQNWKIIKKNKTVLYRYFSSEDVNELSYNRCILSAMKEQIIDNKEIINNKEIQDFLLYLDELKLLTKTLKFWKELNLIELMIATKPLTPGIIYTINDYINNLYIYDTIIIYYNLINDEIFDHKKHILELKEILKYEPYINCSSDAPLDELDNIVRPDKPIIKRLNIRLIANKIYDKQLDDSIIIKIGKLIARYFKERCNIYDYFIKGLNSNGQIIWYYPNSQKVYDIIKTIILENKPLKN